MKHLKVVVLILSVLAVTSSLTPPCAWSGQAAKDETKAMKVELPAAVLEAFKAAYPKAVIKGTSKETEKGVTYYEVESVDGMMNRDLLYTADGKAVEVEESVAPGALPSAVKQSLDKAYPGAKLLKAEELAKDGAVLYELQVRSKGKVTEVTIDPAGKIIEAASGATEPAAAGYRLLKKHVLGGEGGWDYMALDGRTRLLYVTHGNAVEILNVDTGAKGEAITGLQGVHGVAFAPDRNRGYISNGRGNSVTVFDLETHRILGEVPSSGQNPDSVIYDAFSGRVFTFNGRTANATAIDAATDKVVGTVDIGGKPEFAVTDGQGTIYVNNEDRSEVVAFDAKSLEIKKRWSIAPGEGPSGLAIDLKHKRLFSVCDKVMVVSDFENGKVVTTVPVGDGPDAVRYDPGTGLIFASNGGGTLTVVKQGSADAYTVLETVPTARGARTMELDPMTHHVFVVTAEYGPAPAPTPEQPRPRPTVVPGSFMVLEFGK
jgi:DNA-binding beta-propeller fold protein YncE